MSQTAQLDILEEVNTPLKKKWLSRATFTGGGVATILLLSAGGLLYGADSIWSNEAIRYDVGVTLPEDWYYSRELMNMTPCHEPEPRVARRQVNVGYIDHRCQDVDACVHFVRSMADSSHFFISMSHLFEGLGWNCNVTDPIDIKFLGPPDYYDYISYYKLLRTGVDIGELTSSHLIVPDNNTCNKQMCMVA